MFGRFPSSNSTSLDGSKYTNNLSSADKGDILKQSPSQILNTIHDSKTDNDHVRNKLEVISQYHHYNNVLIYESKSSLHKMLIDLYNLDLVTIPALNDSFKENLIILSKKKDNVSEDIVALKNVENYYERFVKDEYKIKQLNEKSKKNQSKVKKHKETGKTIQNNYSDDENDEQDKEQLKEEKQKAIFNTVDPKSLFNFRISPYVIITMSPEKYSKYCDYMQNNKVKKSKDSTLYEFTEDHGLMFKMIVSLNAETVNVHGEANIKSVLDSIRNFGSFCERQNPMFLRWGISKPHYSTGDGETRSQASVTIMSRNRKIINAIKLYGFKNATLSVASNSYIKSDEDFDDIFS
ncbi:hypothetical protein PBI_SCTP2_119 [Salicola phage SCTP-2]|nr:hypothetical protein PBI_SCTP2_119 [Salicola phage SCTP-2]